MYKTLLLKGPILCVTHFVINVNNQDLSKGSDPKPLNHVFRWKKDEYNKYWNT